MEKKVVSTCLQCGKVIRSGRSDKKFCDALCKDEYHNSRKIATHQEIQRIDLALKKNRNILKQLFQPKVDKLVDRDQLLKAGFEFTFHTHQIITKVKQNEFVFCYDYGYREVKEGWYQIIKSF
jgi:hypothetical protein